MFKSMIFEVIGDQQMVCENCERRVERMLKALDGVGKVHAHSRDHQVEVLFDTAVLEPGAIVDRLGVAGYQARVRSASDSGN